ncbi:MAG: YlxM family DNA-binding protein [Ruminiclostridium sp.]|nr:YlxM family DNA-binding protein [Ruminiclostridium sp.]
MDELTEISLLLDFYGQLITKRQFEILDLHYNNDYSLGEIAEQLNISRQGVYDNIKKGKAALNNLEEKLKLIGRFSEQRNKAKVILELLDGISMNILPVKEAQKLEEAKKAVVEIMED